MGAAIASPGASAAEARIGGGATPSTVQQVGRLARYQLRDYLRSRRFILMLGIVGVIGGVLTGIIAYFRPPESLTSPLAFYANFWGMGVAFVITFAGIIFGADAIAGEFQNKTGYFLMGLPIRRVTVYIGKYLAALAAASTAVLVYLGILLGNGAYYFGVGALPWQLGVSFLLALVYLVALVGATFLFSSLFKTSTYATLVVAVLFLFGFTLLQTLVSSLIKVEPFFIISYASAIIGDVFLNPYPAHVAQVPGFGGGGSTTVYTPTIPEGIGIMLIYFVATLLVGLWLFEREEFA
jgi:ABC-2 type transport system permease protein